MKLLKTTMITHKQKAEILDIFNEPGKNEKDEDNTDLIDIMNPYYLSVAILKDYIRDVTNNDERNYTKKFLDVTDQTTVWNDLLEEEDKESWWWPGTKLTQWFRRLDPKRFESQEEPIPFGSEFNTGADRLMHIKFMRLMRDYWAIDVYSVDGLAKIDNIVHTYDLSPGEPFLDRPHPIPTPHHTYNELPIIKYDGYELADWTVPDKDDLEGVEAPIEARLKEFVNILGKSSGQKIHLSDIKADNKLTQEQYAILRSILNLEVKDYRRIEKLKKIWGVMLPDSEIDALFYDQKEKFEKIEKEAIH